MGARSKVVAASSAIALALAAVPLLASPVAAAPPRAPLDAIAAPSAAPRNAQSLGALPPAANLELDLGLTSKDPAGLSAAVTAVSTPTSTHFRQFLSPGVALERFGPSPSAVAEVTAAVRAAGLSVNPSRSGAFTLGVDGTALAIDRFFHLQLNRYRLGRTVGWAAVGAPRVTSAIAPLLTGVSGLTSFAKPHAEAVQTSRLSAPVPCATAASASANGGSHSTDQLATAYGLNALYARGITGKGLTIGVEEFGPYSPNDLATYEACYGVTTPISAVNIDGGPGAISGSNVPEEADLDIEEVASLLPGAKVVVYQANNDAPTASIDVLHAIVTADLAQVVTTSWGICEALATDPGGWDQETPYFQTMALQGQTMVAASGDQGSSDCYDANSHPSAATAVDDPASQPLVTGVGATTLDGVNPTTQTVWGSGSLSGGASGGGPSINFAKPSWQVGPGTSASARRMVPDLSMSGDPNSGFTYYDAFDNGSGAAGWSAIGGTSASSPLFAAVAALAVQGCGQRLGLLNPTLYALAANKATAGAFFDVTSGSNQISNAASGYQAGPGYDMASGLGAPTGALPLDLCAATTQQAATAAGSTTTVTVTAPTAVAMPAGSTVSVDLPAGTTLPLRLGAATAVSVSTTPVAVTASAVAGPGSSTLNVGQLTLASAVAAGSALAISFSGVLLPAKSTTEAVTVSSSAWTLPRRAGSLVVKSLSTLSAVDATRAGEVATVLNQPAAVAGWSGAAVLTDGRRRVVVERAGTPGVVVPLGSLPASIGTPVGLLAAAAQGSTLLVALATSGKHLVVLEQRAGHWSTTDLSRAGGPVVSSAPCALSLAAAGHLEFVVAATSTTGHLLSFTAAAGGSFVRRDLSAATATALAAGPSCAASSGALVAAGLDRRGHLEVLVQPLLTAGAPTATDVTAVASLPAHLVVGGVGASSSAIVVGLRSATGHLLLAEQTPTSWVGVDLDQAAGAGASWAPTLASTPGGFAALACTRTGRLVEFLVRTNRIDAYDRSAHDHLPALVGVPSLALVGTTATVVTQTSGHLLLLTGLPLS